MARYDQTIARIAVILVVLALLIAGCGGTPAQPGVHVQLEHGPLPSLGGVLTVRAIVDSVIDGPDSEIIFYLPAGVRVTSGQERQKVQIQKNMTHIYEIQIQLIQPGEHYIQAGAIIHQGGENLVGGYDRFYLEVTDTETIIREDSLTPTPTTDGIVTDIRIDDLSTPTLK